MVQVYNQAPEKGDLITAAFLQELAHLVSRPIVGPGVVETNDHITICPPPVYVPRKKSATILGDASFSGLSYNAYLQAATSGVDVELLKKNGVVLNPSSCHFAGITDPGKWLISVTGWWKIAGVVTSSYAKTMYGYFGVGWRILAPTSNKESGHLMRNETEGAVVNVKSSERTAASAFMSPCSGVMARTFLLDASSANKTNPTEIGIQMIVGEGGGEFDPSSWLKTFEGSFGFQIVALQVS